MKPTKIILLAAVSAVIATGCYSRRVEVHERAGAAPVMTREVVVAPPTAPIEEMGMAPNPNSAWVPGYWRRTGSRWEWQKGHWETLSRGTTYVPGHWEKRPGGWVYYEGR